MERKLRVSAGGSSWPLVNHAVPAVLSYPTTGSLRTLLWVQVHTGPRLPPGQALIRILSKGMGVPALVLGGDSEAKKISHFLLLRTPPVINGWPRAS